MQKKLLIRDVTLRDGQQSLFATRLTQAQVDRVLPMYKKAGFYAMEVWGGAVPDSIMRYLNENPWDRLEKIAKEVGGISLLTALSRGRNLFGYAPYPDHIIDGFCRNAIESGLSVMRIFDALNDYNNIQTTLKAVKKYGGKADCAVCYTVDPHFSTKERIFAMMKGKSLPKPVFTDDYFINKVKELDSFGADIITLKDMAGLVTPTRVAVLMKKMKSVTKIPINFHTHCTPGYGLASVFMAIVNGVDIIDSNIWSFSGGPAAPSIELINLFCKKAGVSHDVNMEVVRAINEELKVIRKELAPYDTTSIQADFNYEQVPAELQALIDKAYLQASKTQGDALLTTCHEIENYFGFVKPNEIVRDAEIPGGMYTNMLAQLKSLKSEQYLEQAMKLIPRVRLDAGLPPLVTPTSQIVGAQAVSCALSLSKGADMYAIVSNQFSDLVKGQYGHTPIPVNPQFRKRITGSEVEMDYDVSKYKAQPNIELVEAGNTLLAQSEKDQLLLELFPVVAKDYLTRVRKAAYDKVQKSQEEAKPVAPVAKKLTAKDFTGQVITSPLPGRILEIMVKPGDVVKNGDTLMILEAMKMENDIRSTVSGTIKQVLVAVDETVPSDHVLIEFEA